MLICSLTTTQCHLWWSRWRGPELWQCCSGPPTWFGLQIWLSYEHAVWTGSPLILTCWCQHIRPWSRTWSGSNGEGHLGFFCGLLLELEEGCFEELRNGDKHTPIYVVLFDVEA